ncbi:hypothetical protein C8R45DRAFT_1219830 [Mycena sanguinolenta]|nr:hypothetical protein C8R45DRAFT_1219830 [Mycena sanguinolenta]
MLDTLLTLPVPHANCLKFDMLFQTGLAREQLTAHGVTEGPHSVLLTSECATVANFIEICQDSAFVSGFREEMNKLYGHGNHPIINTFLADVQTRIDRPDILASTAKDNQDRTRLVAAMQRPENVPTADEFHERRFCVKHEMWTSNGVIDPHVRVLGLPAPDPDVVIIMLETEHQNGMIQMLSDSDVKQFMEDARHELNIHIGSSFFVAKVVNKISK